MVHARDLSLDMAAIPHPIPARMKQVNRAEVVDQNFVEFVQAHSGPRWRKPAGHEPVAPDSALDASGFLELFESQLINRHLVRRATKATRWWRA